MINLDFIVNHFYWKTWRETNLSNPNAAFDNLVLEVLKQIKKRRYKIPNN